MLYCPTVVDYIRSYLQTKAKSEKKVEKNSHLKIVTHCHSGMKI